MTEINRTEKQNIVIRKLRSEAGASITFALLLFLVCAALSAVVLVAATTAAGRLKNLAVSDRSYYSVMSAADYITDQMDDNTVSVVGLNNSTSYHYFMKPMNEVTEEDIKNIDNIDVTIVPDTDEENLTTAGVTSVSTSEGESELSASFAGVMAELYAGENTSGKHTLSFSESADMTVSIRETFDSSKGLVYMTLYPGADADDTAGTAGGAVKLVFSYDEAEKYPPVTQVETEDDVRRVTYGREMTWHLVKLTNAFDDNGDI